MDHRTRIKAAISHLPVDDIPCAELVIEDELVQEMCGVAVVQFSHRLEFVRNMGLDAICLHPKYFERMPASKNIIFEDVHSWVKTDLFTFAVIDGPVSWGIKLYGFEELMFMLSSPCHMEFKQLMLEVEKTNMELMESLAGNGANGIVVADDIAFNQGLFVRPDILRQTVFASLTRQVDYAKRLNLPIFFHSDGNLMLVIEDLVTIGFDGLQCIDTLAGMELATLKQRYSNKLCLWGNLDPRELIESRNINELEQSVISIINDTKGSGLIFGTSSGLFNKMRLESIKAIYEIVKSA